MMRSALDNVSACASVLATTKSTPCRPAAIMLFTALPPAPPTPNTVSRAFISRISLMLVMFASFARGCRPCGLLQLWSRLNFPVAVRLVLGRWPIGRRSPELRACLQAVPSLPSPPWSRQSPGVVLPPVGLRARVHARNLPGDSLPLLRTVRSQPAMPRSLPSAAQRCLADECLVGGVCAESPRNQRSPALFR